ncbi:PEP-CTERM sorting domain-containing protein [Puniceicoccales bacterium CK1056]|uniref:PEP-CTERM sorting domain-containing protein n=1 Tax=Oceanipulchritudo coccoides TaxID=2706888 RepID=A0A6B2LY68_9BACT|nr:PEP-CTERM sorting domain-containing protein [Oceanipulchritudo coccoides]NDV61568.1 PEP-CTERM sorting domain-containing protein [Oceanipulchritudo coccoides]
MNNIKQLLLVGSLLSTISSYAQIVVNFDVDLSPDAQSFAAAGAASLALNFTIDGSGNIALDAVALGSGGGAASPARWNQVDNATAGTTTAAALYNTSFTLTFSGSAAPSLNFPSYDNAGSGAVLVTQGEGNATALESGEFVTFSVSGTATAVTGFSLDLANFSYGRRLANGGSSFGVEDTSGTVIEQLIPNTSTSGTISGIGISLSAGEDMTFRTITGNAGGAGLSGFEFSVSAVPEPSTYALMAAIATFGFVVWRRRQR